VSRDERLVYATASLRAVAVGAVSVFFAVHLARAGFDRAGIGLGIAAGLGGMAAGTMLAGLVADRFGRRRSLVVIALATAFGGIALTFTEGFGPVLLASFVGMVNGMGRDRGAAQAIDQAVLAQVATGEDRTRAFVRYTLVVDVATAFGSLLAGVTLERQAFVASLWVYAVLLGATALAYPRMSAGVEPAEPTSAQFLSPESRRRVTAFAALSAVDSLGGGFVTRALLSYWFIERFHADPWWMGPMFAGASLVNAASYPVAGWLARRVGLVNTMVFTHIPSSALLMLVPFAPNFVSAVVLFFVREFLSTMDVPTRQSYLAAIVADHERTAAAGIANMTRNASWVVGPSLAGWAMTLSFSLPLFLAGGLKIAYDLALWRAFRRIRPPEEQGGHG
jgi:MFS family permease